MGRYEDMKCHDEMGQLLTLRFDGPNYAWEGGQGQIRRAMHARTWELGITFPPIFRMCRNVTLPGPCPCGSLKSLVLIHLVF